MLTRADDFPIHQTPEPVAYAGSDRNFYDRYFFNGYTRDGEHFFAAAMGIYPHLNLIDASFCVIRDGIQHNLHASRVLNFERLDTVVGPIRIEIVEPLKQLRLLVDSPEHGLHADVMFHARTSPIEEPRFVRRIGARTMMDYTRLTQNGSYEGSIGVDGRTVLLARESVRGTRDRSWGVRPIGVADPQPTLPMQLPQFYWLWAPLNFEEHATFFHLNDDAEGRPWNTRGVLASVGNGEPRDFADVAIEVKYRSGTRRVERATLLYRDRGREALRVEVEPRFHFYMPGLGYMHPEWGHGIYRGDLAVGYDSYRAGEIDDGQPGMMHIQAFSRAGLELADGTRHDGCGVVEQLIIGPHAPSGFRELFDPAR